MRIQGELRVERVEPFRLFGVAGSRRVRVILARHQPARGSAVLRAELVLPEGEAAGLAVGEKLRATVELSRYDGLDA